MKTFKLKELVFGNSGNITKETIIQNFKNSGFIYTINEDDGEELLTYHIHKEHGVVFEIVFIKEYIIKFKVSYYARFGKHRYNTFSSFAIEIWDINSIQYYYQLCEDVINRELLTFFNDEFKEEE